MLEMEDAACLWKCGKVTDVSVPSYRCVLSRRRAAQIHSVGEMEAVRGRHLSLEEMPLCVVIASREGYCFLCTARAVDSQLHASEL